MTRRLRSVAVVLVLMAAVSGWACAPKKPDTTAVRNANIKVLCVAPATIAEMKPAKLSGDTVNRIKDQIRGDMVTALKEVAPAGVTVIPLPETTSAGQCDARMELKVKNLNLVTSKDTAKSIVSSVAGVFVLALTGIGWTQHNNAGIVIETPIIDMKTNQTLWATTEAFTLQKASFTNDFVKQTFQLMKGITARAKKHFPLQPEKKKK
jgi:hypothetical protein